MSDRLLKESDVLKIAFQLPLVVNSAFADAVKALPSTDRPSGEWIDKPTKGVRYICSRCTGRFDYQWKYCPNCGADMRGTDDETN